MNSLPCISDFGSFYIGGKNFTVSEQPIYETTFVKGGPTRKVNPNGDFETGQMYVQYFHLAQPRTKIPVLLWHGGGVTGASWENTPDGREGWLHMFLRAGYDTYISDAVERGRAGWSSYPNIYRSEPIFRSKQEAWVNFRIGPSYSQVTFERSAYPNSQFPTDYFDVFMKQNVPRWTTNNDAITAAYEEYLKRIGLCILVVHSQASEFAGKLIQKYPEKIKAVVMLEASSVPEIDDCYAEVPTLYVWGDHVFSNTLWDKYRSRVYQFFLRQKELKKPVEWLELPSIGIKGNSHFLMMDKNNHQIFNQVNLWLSNFI